MIKAFLRTIIYAFLFIGFSFQMQAQSWAAVKRGDKWYFIDKKGNVMLNKLFDGLGDRFTEGLVPAKLEGKWGYINTAGKSIIKHRYSKAYNFHNGRAIVQEDSAWFLINKKGKIVSDIKISINHIDTFTEGIGFIEAENEYIYILPTGKILRYENKTYQEAHPFYEGMARVRSGTKYGYIDTSGKLKIPLNYFGASDFNEGLANVYNRGEFHLIDKNNKVIDTIPAIEHAIPFVRYVAPLFDGSKYFIHNYYTNQNIPVDLQHNNPHSFNYVHPFTNDGWARFWGKNMRTGFLYGYLHVSGKIMHAYRFELAKNFSEGMAAVKLNGLYGYINTKGETTIDFMFDEARDFYPIR